MEQLHNLRELNNFAEFEYMFNFAHRKSAKREFIGILKKNTEDKLEHKCLSTDRAFNKILHHLESSPEDIYFTLNSFYKPKRVEENLRYMNCLFVDLDFYKIGLTQKEVIKEIDRHVKENNIPKPSMLIDSGRGMYVIWKIKPIPSMAVKLWRFTVQHLCKKLSKLNSDFACTDPGRVLRVPGSINSKCGKRVEIITVNEIEYDIHDIKSRYLPSIDKVKEKKENKKITERKKIGNVSYLFNPNTLNITRSKDIEKLCEIREYDIKNRELTLFVYRNCLEKVYGKEIAIRRMLDLHGKFKNKLGSDRAIIGDTNSISSKIVQGDSYNLKNETIIKWLNITSEEQEQLTCLIEKRVKNTRAKELKKQRRRNQNGLLKKEQEKLNIAKEILKLKKKNRNIKQKDIAEELNLSKSRVSRIINEIEQGLIKGLTEELENNKKAENGLNKAFREELQKTSLYIVEDCAGISKKKKPPD